MIPTVKRASEDRGRILLTSLSGQLGGMELRLVDEARFLTTAGYRPILALSPFPGRDEWLNSLRLDGIELSAYCPSPFFEEWSLRRARLLKAKLIDLCSLRRIGARYAHVAYAWTHMGGSRLCLCHMAGLPTVLSVHNTFPPHTLVPWHDRLMARSFEAVKGLYAVSQAALDAFLAIYGKYVRTETVLRTIYNFVDTDRFIPSSQYRASTRADLAIPQDAAVIGSVGRLDIQKEPLHVLDVFAAVRSRVPNAYLVFVGSGPLLRDAQRKVEQLGLTGHVRFAGFRTDVERFFPSFDVHLLFSKQEGFGISTAEALSCGVAVVVSNAPGTAEVLQLTAGGLTVPYGDVRASADAILMLLADRARLRRIGEEARAAVQRHFSTTAFRQRLIEFYALSLGARAT